MQAETTGRRGPDATKFEEPESDIMPPASPVWLKSVDLSPNRHRQVHVGLLLGYQFPDPHMFLHTGRLDRYLCAWLTVRAAWIQSILNASGSERLPMTQQWRDFLNRKIDHHNPGVKLSGPFEEGSCSPEREDHAARCRNFRDAITVENTSPAGVLAGTRDPGRRPVPGHSHPQRAGPVGPVRA